MADRRTLKTDRAIFEALQNLAERMPLAKITVTDVARTANITRKTFYDHFPNVTDAYSALLAHLVEELAEKTERDWELCAQSELECTPADETETRLMLFLGNVREFVEQQEASSRRRSHHVSHDELVEYLGPPFARCVRQGLLGDPARFAGEEELVAEFVLTGILWMYRRWITRGTDAPLSDAQVRVCKLVLYGIDGMGTSTRG